MSNKRQVYLLDPQKLPPETIAVTFAKTSRSPESFREIAAELTDTSSAEFNEKWVVGYGHSSVAEHAVLHIALENISRLAVETLESNRLASYTEKSTRYQTWSDDAFYTPQELQGHVLLDPYTKCCQLLFSTYRQCLQELTPYLVRSMQPEQGETQAQFDRRVRTMAIDVCRFLLPASSLANVGMTINARALEHAIGKLLSQSLEETQQIGAEVKRAAGQSVPTLLKYAHEIPYLQTVCFKFSQVHVPGLENDSEWCRLAHVDPQPMARVLAAALYREKHITYAQALEWVEKASTEQKKVLLNYLLETPDPHTIPSRELESIGFTFDLLIDQGAYFEIKRHRMMTQTPQHLTADLGYAVPRIMVDAGLLEPYQAAMEQARQTYTKIAEFNPAVASYIVPNGYNRRVLLNVNLRSLMHFIRLRSAPNAHFSVRRAAQRMAEEVCARVPELGTFPGKNSLESAGLIEETYFHSTCQR
jgi:thymidylate synthase ThyX